MKKRTVSLLLAVLMLAALAVPALAAEVFRLEACPTHCGGFLLTHKNQIGISERFTLEPCNLNERFFCPVYEVTYQEVKECNHCDYVYGVVAEYTVREFRHDHSAG